MNKQEATELVKNTSYSVPINDSVKYLREETVIKIIDELDEPEKPVVPQFVADWYEEHKDYFEWNLYEFCVEFHKQELPDDLHNWFRYSDNKPIETLVMMHKFGYEVEEGVEQ